MPGLAVLQESIGPLSQANDDQDRQITGDHAHWSIKTSEEHGGDANQRGGHDRVEQKFFLLMRSEIKSFSEDYDIDRNGAKKQGQGEGAQEAMSNWNFLVIEPDDSCDSKDGAEEASGE